MSLHAEFLVAGNEECVHDERHDAVPLVHHGRTVGAAKLALECVIVEKAESREALDETRPFKRARRVALGVRHGLEAIQGGTGHENLRTLSCYHVANNNNNNNNNTSIVVCLNSFEGLVGINTLR